MPVAYIPHGGGPWPFVDLGLDPAEIRALAAYCASLRDLHPPGRPTKAVLVVSAHWETPVPTLMTAAHPPLLYDYYGFPPAAYQLRWPAPGSPELAARAQALLTAAGFQTATDPARGFDHGTFVPLLLTYPQADVPVVQLSLLSSLDPRAHLDMGRALAPLRDDDVLILGSGMSFHNLRTFFRPDLARPAALAFDAWLRDAVSLDPPARAQRLAAWGQAPGAAAAHPRAEHLLPLLVVAGAAQEDRATIGFHGTFASLPITAVHFG
jgi:aromatic ring-opening dioxygenase catalytic subunit (LigB family)